jgi:hypothetical protein
LCKTKRGFIVIAFQQFCFRTCQRKAQENKVWQKLNGTLQILAYADDMNLLGDNINTVKENRNFN